MSGHNFTYQDTATGKQVDFEYAKQHPEMCIRITGQAPARMRAEPTIEPAPMPSREQLKDRQDLD